MPTLPATDDSIHLPGLITLRPSYGVDLDDVTEPSWNVGTASCDRDVRFGDGGRQLSIDGGHAAR